jgi:hypothetical protein
MRWSRVKFVQQCKICGLYSKRADLFTELHNLVMNVGFSHTRAMLVINKKIERINARAARKGQQPTLHFLNEMNFSTHFRNHLPINISTALRIRKSKLCAVKLEEGEKILQAHMDEAVTANLSDYERLSNIVDKFEKRFNEIEEELDKRGLTWGNVQDYTSLIRELTRMRAELIKLKQSDRLVSVIISQVLQDYTVGSLKGISEALDNVKQELLSVTDINRATGVTNRLRAAIIGGMETNSKTVIEAVSKQFKLKL